MSKRNTRAARVWETGEHGHLEKRVKGGKWSHVVPDCVTAQSAQLRKQEGGGARVRKVGNFSVIIH